MEAKWTATTPVLVVGSGAAGLTAVINLIYAGIDTVVVTKSDLTASSTDWAQGGLAAVWDPGDSLEAHVQDTLVAGAGLCVEASVRTLVQEAPKALEWMMSIGARFDRGDNGEIDLHLEGGHSARRILHSNGDASGHEIEITLAKNVAAMDGATWNTGGQGSLKVYEDCELCDVLVDTSGRTCGATVLSETRGFGVISATAVILATGGIGQLWNATTNPEVANGSGLAAALRAGATGRDLEFMQFHPTIFVPPVKVPGDRGVLVSEAVRGEGAFLVDGAGNRVMEGVHPLKDLAPRDVVSAAEQEYMMAHGLDHLFLDATDFGEKKWKEKFPTIYELVSERGVDPIVEPIPVRPGAHYYCGGIATSMSGETRVPGLYAIGEVACTGVQGANRLASNSLTEALVMGNLVSKQLALSDLPKLRQHPAGQPAKIPEPVFIESEVLLAIQKIMSRDVSVLRERKGLERAVQELAELPAAQTIVARALVSAALTREESRGTHRRLDFPERREEWVKHLDVSLAGKDRLEIEITQSVAN